MFARSGCGSSSPEVLAEIPFLGGNSINLAVRLYYIDSYARVWYMILNESLSSGKEFDSYSYFILLIMRS